MLEKFAEAGTAAAAAQAFFDHLFQGGALIMLPIMAAAVMLWYALGYRWATLRRGSRKSVRVMIRRALDGRTTEPYGMVDRAIARGIEIVGTPRPHQRRFLDESFAQFDRDLKRYSLLIKVLVGIAPLLGLLGTVIGMIETFDSLGDMTLHSQSGGVAAGIATALFTTQLGLVVAVPGMIAMSFLDRRQFQIEVDLSAVKDLLLSTGATAK